MDEIILRRWEPPKQNALSQDGFKKAHQLESYLGLVPSEDSSGGKRRLGGISKRGNPYMRALLVQSAWCILRLRDTSDPIKAWADSLAERRGKRVAVVAIARRLAGVLWAMWRDGTQPRRGFLGPAHRRRPVPQEKSMQNKKTLRSPQRTTGAKKTNEEENVDSGLQARRIQSRKRGRARPRPRPR